MQVRSLIADIWGMDGGVVFGVVPKTIWRKYFKSNERNFVEVITRNLLIETDDKKILIDVGMGDKQSERYYEVREKNNNYNIVKSLKEIGISPEQITDIIFTHLHDDHVGAATYIENGETKHTFVNAKYWVGERQWKWASNPNKREVVAYRSENILPILDSGKLNLIKENEQPFDNIELQHYYGHTEGIILPKININGKPLIFVSDVIPSTYHLPLVYLSAVDINPLLAIEEKNKILTESIETNTVLFFQHDPNTECCTVAKNEKGFELKDSFTLQNYLK